jgi:hypothetical protein
MLAVRTALFGPGLIWAGAQTPSVPGTYAVLVCQRVCTGPGLLDLTFAGQLVLDTASASTEAGFIATGGGCHTLGSPHPRESVSGGPVPLTWHRDWGADSTVVTLWHGTDYDARAFVVPADSGLTGVVVLSSDQQVRTLGQLSARRLGPPDLSFCRPFESEPAIGGRGCSSSRLGSPDWCWRTSTGASMAPN